jgi:hypothetical protein
VSELTWSPDGQTLAFRLGAQGTHVASAVTGAPTRVGDNGASAVSWSPDGKHLAFDDDTDVWVATANGKRVRRITQGGRYGHEFSSPLWNPAGLPVSEVAGEPAEWTTPSDSLVTQFTLRTRGRIGLLSADGYRVAVTFVDRTPCVELWNTRSRHLTRFPDDRCTGDRFGAEAGGTFGLAVASPRVAWLDNMQTNHWNDWLHLASELAPAPRTVAAIEDVGEIGPPAGDGDLIAFSLYRGDPRRTTVMRATVPRAVSLRSFKGDTVSVLAVDQGRILVDSKKDLAVLRSDGSTAATIAGGDVPARLAGETLVAQRGPRLVVHAVPSGAVLRTIPIPTGVELVDAEGRLAVLVGDDRTVTVVDVSDGRRATFHPPGKGRVLAQIEPIGLVMATTVGDARYPGRVELVSMTKVRDKLG